MWRSDLGLVEVVVAVGGGGGIVAVLLLLVLLVLGDLRIRLLGRRKRVCVIVAARLGVGAGVVIERVGGHLQVGTLTGLGKDPLKDVLAGLRSIGASRLGQKQVILTRLRAVQQVQQVSASIVGRRRCAESREGTVLGRLLSRLLAVVCSFHQSGEQAGGVGRGAGWCDDLGQDGRRHRRRRIAALVVVVVVLLLRLLGLRLRLLGLMMQLLVLVMGRLLVVLLRLLLRRLLLRLRLLVALLASECSLRSLTADTAELKQIQ